MAEQGSGDERDKSPNVSKSKGARVESPCEGNVVASEKGETTIEPAVVGEEPQSSITAKVTTVPETTVATEVPQDSPSPPAILWQIPRQQKTPPLPAGLLDCSQKEPENTCSNQAIPCQLSLEPPTLTSPAELPNAQKAISATLNRLDPPMRPVPLLLQYESELQPVLKQFRGGSRSSREFESAALAIAALLTRRLEGLKDGTSSRVTYPNTLQAGLTFKNSTNTSLNQWVDSLENCGKFAL